MADNPRRGGSGRASEAFWTTDETAKGRGRKRKKNKGGGGGGAKRGKRGGGKNNNNKKNNNNNADHRIQGLDPAVLPISEQEPVLWTDAQVQEFIVRGVAVVDPGLPEEFHDAAYEAAQALFPDDDGEGGSHKKKGFYRSKTNPGNNVLPRMPMLNDVYDSPPVRGALISLLGDGYMMHPHRFPHLSRPGNALQKWHKDSYWGTYRTRSHRPNLVMAMYYPQDTPLELGPTAVAPRTQYYSTHKSDRSPELPDDWAVSGYPAVVAKGSVVIIAYDIYHRATQNVSDVHRFMFKFQFVRMEVPQSPSWNSQSPEWSFVSGVGDDLGSGDDGDGEEGMAHRALWESVWNWMRGDPEAEVAGRGDGRTIDDLADALASAHEPIRIDAAYELGAADRSDAAIDLLLQHTISHSKDQRDNKVAPYGLAAAGQAGIGAINELFSKTAGLKTIGVFLMGELGPAADATDQRVDKLVRALGDRNDKVRREAALAIGKVQTVPCVEAAVAHLAAGEEQDAQTRFNLVLSIGQASADVLALDSDAGAEMTTDSAVAVLAHVMKSDPNRYARQYAMRSLERLADNHAMARRLLTRHLFGTHHCVLTTGDSQF